MRGATIYYCMFAYQCYKFQLTRPMRGATYCIFTLLAEYDQISTHTPHAGRNIPYQLTLYIINISTHTPHAGRNIDYCFYRSAYLYHFNSHAPCGAQLTVDNAAAHIKIFQLTRPMRGATNKFILFFLLLIFQLTRPMRGATNNAAWAITMRRISTHTPHAGRNKISCFFSSGNKLFQLTRPMRGATKDYIQ